MVQGEVKEVGLDELGPDRHCEELRLHSKLQDFKQVKDDIFRREFCPILSPLAHRQVYHHVTPYPKLDFRGNVEGRCLC